jgi:hypothetical protein
MKLSSLFGNIPHFTSALLTPAALVVLSLAVAAQTGTAAGAKSQAALNLKPTPTPTPTPTPAAAPAQSPAPLKVGPLTVSGSLRLRFESWDWFDAPGHQDSYNFGAGVLRLAVGQQREKVEWQVEGAFPLLVGLPDNAVAPAPQGQLGLGAAYFAANGRRDGAAILKQAFVRFKGFGGQANSLKVGRFEFNDGAEVMPADVTLAIVKRDHVTQRLIGTFGFTHVGRSFDGAQYSYNTKRDNFTLFAARPTEGVFQLSANRQLDVDLYYAAYTRQTQAKKAAGEARAFVIHYHDGRRVPKIDNRPASLRAADTENIRVTTVGGHHISAIKAGAGVVDTLVWGAAQFGRWGALGHRAGALAVEGGYQFRGKAVERIKPWVRAGYFRSTGDGDANDATHATFFQMLPTPRIYARFPFYNLMNNEDLFGQLRLKPHAKVGVRVDVHHVRLSSTRDSWYLAGGAFQKNTFGFAARPSGGRKSLATLVDASVDYNVTPRTTLSLFVSGARGGDVAGGIYPTGRNARFALVELTQRF